jgi:L-cysteine S-thiosulfotransferase
MARVVSIVVACGLLQACAAEWGPGFHLPQGDADRGREAFIALGCNVCHSVAGHEPPLSGPGTVVLGGDTTRVKTYGDLVTSIVNPSHEVASEYRISATQQSPMTFAFLNEVVTIQQLVDMVAFLQDEYEFIPPPVSVYWETYRSVGTAPTPGVPPQP